MTGGEFRRGLGLRGKLVAVICLPMLVLVTGLLCLSSSREVERARAADVHDVESVVQALSQDFERMHLFDDRTIALEVADRLRSFPDIEHLHVIHRDGRMLFAYTGLDLPPIEPPSEDGPAQEFVGHSLHLRMPLSSGGERFATACVQTSTRRLDAQALRARNETLTAGAGTAVLGVVLALILQSLISRPILALHRAAGRVAETDDYTVRAEVTSRDEIGSLALAFNAMLGRIAESAALLRRAHDVLEERVAERTSELLATNRELVQVLADRERAQQERQKLEIQLRHAQKMEAIGQLAAGIAHEINTPTQFITDNTRFIKESFQNLDPLLRSYVDLVDSVKSTALAPGLVTLAEGAARTADLAFIQEEIPRAIDQSLEGLQRIAQIVSAMKEFSSADTDRTPIDLNQTLENTLAVTGNAWRSVADVELSLDPGLDPVLCLPGELRQVFVNLLLNATQAMADAGGDVKGRIKIATARRGALAEVRISDTGPGIHPDVLPRIFEPFFTTRPLGEGRGQGLSFAWAVVVEHHGGTLEVETELGRGTTFIVRLPCEERATAALAA